MNKLALIVAVGVVAGAATATHIATRDDVSDQGISAATPSDGGTPAYVPAILRRPAPVPPRAVDSAYADAARVAWAFLDRGYVPRTGLIVAQPDWPYPTLWDIASTLASYYSARGLGFITDAEYEKRVLRALATLNTAALYDNSVFGRNYDARTGDLIGAGHEAAGHGTGFSTLDVGRLLIWLKIVGNSDPDINKSAQQIVRRLNAKRMIEGGYLYGETQPTKGRLSRYQEGRLGYEQYAATGFVLWGFDARRAADFGQSRPVTVNGIPLLVDKRGLDRLTSEPLILHGLEVGLSGKMSELAWQALSLQALRFGKTGQVTIASEDAIPLAPHYFYYYCIYCGGKPFVINIHTPGKNFDSPRWVSTKGAFAWHALMPSDYTWKGVQAVAPARSTKGWASGVYEKTGKSTDTITLNTAAVILEAALYRKTGKPFLSAP